jgi:hypothetical protein
MPVVHSVLPANQEDQMADTNPAALEAKHGKKMIEVSLRFWTNDISEEPGKVIPKHAWTSGVVRIQGNESHGIVPGSPLPFHSLLDIGSVIEKVLLNHGVVLHPSTKMDKYCAPRPSHVKPKSRWIK